MPREPVCNCALRRYMIPWTVDGTRSLGYTHSIRPPIQGGIEMSKHVCPLVGAATSLTTPFVASSTIPRESSALMFDRA